MSHHNQTERPYDDQNVIEDCEFGWRRFCCEVLGRTFHMVGELSRRHRAITPDAMRTMGRKHVEVLRRQVAAYRWVFEGTGGPFSFRWACEMCGRDHECVRDKIVAAHQPHRDIKYVVDLVKRYGEKRRGRRHFEHQAADGMAAGVAASVAAFRRQRPGAEGGTAGPTAAKAGGQDANAGRRPAAEKAGRRPKDSGRR